MNQKKYVLIRTHGAAHLHPIWADDQLAAMAKKLQGQAEITVLKEKRSV